MKTAQSHRAWERRMAPNLSGKKRYARPQMKPATAADMMSMKFILGRWTRLYTSVVTMKPIFGFHLLERVFWTYPLQNISSAGPMIRSIKAVSINGFSPSFIPYIMST